MGGIRQVVAGRSALSGRTDHPSIVCVPTVDDINPALP